MDCPKFIPNIFYPSKCRQCFKSREDHRLVPSNKDNNSSGGRDVPSQPSPDVLKCGHLFIAPLDYLPLDPHSRNKRWQRRWFILVQPGILSYSIDDHPEAVPQGSIDLTLLEELRSGEEVTGHEYSFILKSPKATVFLKGSSGDESRKWVRLLSKYAPNTVEIFGSCIRRSSSSCASTASNATLDERGAIPTQNEAPQAHLSSSAAPKAQIQIIGKGKPLVRLRSYTPAYEKMATTTTTAKKSSATHLRGDPDGGEQVVTVDSAQSPSKWTLNSSSSSSLKSATGDISAKLESLKAQLASRKWDLERQSKDSSVGKSERLALDNMKLQLNSYFIEIDKLSYAVNVREGELKGLLKAKESELGEIQTKLRQMNALAAKNSLLEDENRLLVERINDLTEKFYGVEKNSKVLKSKLHRYRTNSLKDKDLELEVTSKVAQLESRLNQFLPQETPPPSPTQQTHGPSPVIEKKASLLGVIVKLNELEKRLEGSEVFNPTEWYKCGNCEFLQEEIHERDSKLNELETMVNSLESTLNHTNAIRSKYEGEVAEMQSLCADSLRSLETAYNRLVRELEEKHCLEMTQFDIAKEKEMEDETRATRNALELLKRSYEMELGNGIAEAREELLRKYRDKGTSLQELHHQHEEETHALREKVKTLTLKYSEKCLETVQLQEAFIQRNVS